VSTYGLIEDEEPASGQGKFPGGDEVLQSTRRATHNVHLEGKHCSVNVKLPIKHQLYDFKKGGFKSWLKFYFKVLFSIICFFDVFN